MQYLIARNIAGSIIPIIAYERSVAIARARAEFFGSTYIGELVIDPATAQDITQQYLVFTECDMRVAN